MTDLGRIEAAAVKRPGLRRIKANSYLRSLLREKAAMASLGFLILLVLGAVFAPLITSHSPSGVQVLDRYIPPAWNSDGSMTYLLGTDGLGRDVFSRLLYGARVSLFVGVSVVLLAGIMGTVLGLLAGYKGGHWDTVIMRIADAQLAFPGLLLILLILGFVGRSLAIIIVVLSLYGWMIFARQVRGVVLQLRQTPYVQAAQLTGCSTPRILAKHLMPGLYSVLMTQAMIEFARVVLAEASLSYLGLGVQPPDASLGLMVAENQGDVASAWWTVVLPGALLSLIVLSINIVANWLRVQTDPTQRRRRMHLRVDSSAAVESGTPASPRVAESQREPALLTVRDLRVGYHTEEGRVDAVRSASLQVFPGETVGIVGESGSGKSSVALAIIDMIAPPGRIDGGEIAWQGRPLSRRDQKRLRGSEISMIFQDPMTSLNPLVPVGRQIAEVMIRHLGMSKKQAWDRAAELLDLVGVPSPRHRLHQRPHQLSGGLRQRVMIASALAAEPKLLIADEPTTALDATIQAQILDLIGSIQSELGISVLLITHDLGVVASVCSRVVVMYGGHVVERAPVEALFGAARHRYSRALLETAPRLDVHHHRLPVIPGNPPSLRDLDGGCPFAPRCAARTAACDEMPPFVADNRDGLSGYACWNPVQPDHELVTS